MREKIASAIGVLFYAWFLQYTWHGSAEGWQYVKFLGPAVAIAGFIVAIFVFMRRLHPQTLLLPVILFYVMIPLLDFLTRPAK